MKLRALAVLLLLGALAVAQDEGAGAPPSRTREPKRVLGAIVAILKETDRKETKAALAGLRDESWAVRALAAVRLGVLGLDERTVRALRSASRPGSKAPAADDANVKKAEKFAGTVMAKEKGGSGEATIGNEGIRAYASLVANELSVKEAPAAELKKLVLPLPDFADAAEDKRAKGFIARELVALCDEDQIAKDLGVKKIGEAFAEDGKRVYEWFQSNAPFLYLHPKEGALRVDLAARSAGTPTEDFRAKNAWGADEGPNAPARRARDIK